MTIKGIIYLLMALLVFAIQDAIVKHLTQQFEVIQILTWRIIAVVVILAIIAFRQYGWLFLQTDFKALMFLRGFLAFSAFTNYYFALSVLPLADAATVYMTAPLFVTALSVPLLGEHVGVRRWLAVIVGFSAVVFMLNPGSGLFQAIAFLPLASALFYSFIPIVTRRFKANERTLTITFYTASCYAVLCLILSAMVHIWPATATSGDTWAFVAQPWTPLDAKAWALTLLTSVLFTAGIIFITAAYRAADVSALAPFEYSYLIWATLIGFVLFADVPTLRTLLAASVIAGSGIYIAIRERQQTAR